MKTFFIKSIIPLLLLSSIYTYGQGIIKGTVTDSLTAVQLKGAEIILTGTNFNTVSNIDGEFYISGIPPGDYILHASYLGYKEKEILVAVKTKGLQILNIELLPNILTANETELSSQAKSQAEEINMQIRSNIIKNVIPGIKLQNMPDEDIPVTLSRLPGVSINYINSSFLPEINYIGETYNANIPGDMFPPLNDFHFSGSPDSKILIRGLDSKYSNISINGIIIPSTSENDNSVDPSIFSEMDFQNIELDKTITSDEDADATAGAIKMFTGKAPYKRKIKVDLSGNYNELDKSANQYNFNGYYGERFLDNLLGVQVDAKLEKKIMSNEFRNNLSRAWWTTNVSYFNAESERKEANILLDFITPDAGSIKFNNFFNKINSDYFGYGADTLFGNIKNQFSNRETDQRLFLSSIEGSNHLFGFDIDWNAAFSELENDHPFYFTLNFYDFPYIFNPTSTDRYLDNSVDSPIKNYFKEKTVSIDISKRYNLVNEITGELKFGGKYRINSRNYDEYLHAETGGLDGNNQYIKLSDGSLVKKDFSGTRFDGLLGKSLGHILLSNFQDDPSGERTVFDKYKIPMINTDALRLWRQLNYGSYNYGADINSYNYSENVFAGYVMHTFNFRQSAIFITGLRIESEQNNYGGYYYPNLITSPAGLYNGTPLKTNTFHYNKITTLPNFQMILKPTDFLNLKLAAYKTLIRPDYNARAPKYFRVTNSVNDYYYLDMGNPDLKNADVWNYEFQTQFYGNVIGMFSINAFYKDIKGLQLPTSGFILSSVNAAESFKSLGINLNSFPVDNPYGNTNNNFNLYTYYNSPKPTHIWGFEVEHQANFRYLPELLKNIVLNYNFTFLRSESWADATTWLIDTTARYSIADQKQKFCDMPEFFANVILGYDIKGFSFRISYFYQDGYPLLGYYYRIQTRKNRLSRLDIAAKQALFGNISATLILNNITNLKEEMLYKSTHESVWRTAQAYRCGMNVNFGIVIDL